MTDPSAPDRRPAEPPSAESPPAGPPRRMSWPFRLWFAFLGLVAVGMIAAAVWSALVVMEAGPAGYRGMDAKPPTAAGRT